MPLNIDSRWLVPIAAALAVLTAQLVWQWGEDIVGDERGIGQVGLAALLAACFVGLGSWLLAESLIAHSPSDLVWGAASAFYLALAIVGLQDARTMHVHDYASAGLMFASFFLGWISGNGLIGEVLTNTWHGAIVALAYYAMTVLMTRVLKKDAVALGDPLFMIAISPCMGGVGVAYTLFLGAVLSLAGYLILHRRSSQDGRFAFLPYLALAAGIVAIFKPELGGMLGILGV